MSEDPATAGPSLLVDDFAREDGVSRFGTAWRRFTDGVMGGLSRAESRLEVVDGRRALRLTGTVSLANRGGFIQAALPLAAEGRTLDASAYRGIRLRVRCAGTGYFLHLRSADCRLPWHHYAAPLPDGDGWTEVELPFAAFTPQSLDRPLRPSALTSIGVVAAKRAFAADVAVSRLEFYR